MSLIELLTTVRALCRADRIRLVQCLIADLAREEGITPLEEGTAYPIWTPLHAFEAAATMLEAVGKHNAET
ncbi:MAG: hypothetical protein ACRD2L_17010 [Terriglobia bacterium]